MEDFDWLWQMSLDAGCEEYFLGMFCFKNSIWIDEIAESIGYENLEEAKAYIKYCVDGLES